MARLQPSTEGRRKDSAEPESQHQACPDLGGAASLKSSSC